MILSDFQMPLIVAVILTAAVILMIVDYRRKNRQRQQLQRVRASAATAGPRRPVRILDNAPVEYVPAKRAATTLVSEPVVATATASRPPVEPRVERDTVTVQLASTPPSLSPDSSLPSFTIDLALWERLISTQPAQTMLSTTAPRAISSPNTVEAARHMIQQDDSRLRADAQRAHGMIQQAVLEQLLEQDEPFTGLVVSIGINDSDSSMWHSKGLMQSIGSYIAGLLNGEEFCCRSAYDEFVMVCPGEQGAQSQRRLNHISERLWDYQLRGLGACSILFSWGGVQSQNQPLAEAIANATDRMRQTKRSSHSPASALAQREAV